VDKEQTVSRRLEPERWWTTRRENPDDYQEHASVKKWASIAAAIINYQNRHGGQSPTDATIARDAGLTLPQVHYHMHEMEKAGLIAERRGFPRHIVMGDVAKVQRLTQLEIKPPQKVKEAKVVHTTNNSVRKPFMDRARLVAQAVMDHYDQHGEAPRSSWVAEQVFGHTRRTGSLTRVVREMVELGWLYHKNGCHRDMALTGAGRAALFGQINDTLHTDTPVSPTEKKMTAAEAGSLGGQARARNLPPERLSEIGRLGGQRKAAMYSEQPAMEIRRAQPGIPRPVPEAETYAVKPHPDAVQLFEDIDLVLELNRRGYRVSK
jgi:general stress protein YciG